MTDEDLFGGLSYADNVFDERRKPRKFSKSFKAALDRKRTRDHRFRAAQELRQSWTPEQIEEEAARLEIEKAAMMAEKAA